MAEPRNVVRDIAVAFDNVSAHYGQALALDDVSIRAERGATVSIVGANGAGKTTCLRVMSGLLKPTSGRVMVNSHDVSTLSAAKLVGKGLAHSPEGRRVFPEMTVRENLLVGGFLVREKGLLEARLAEAFDFFPVLDERQGQLAGTMSGGQQQMLAIARAMMSGPSVLLLDEPTLGLSPKMTKEVEGLIAAIRARGLTIILVEQNAEIALGLADYAYVMESGRITAEGSASDIANSDSVRRAYLGA